MDVLSPPYVVRKLTAALLARLAHFSRDESASGSLKNERLTRTKDGAS